MKMKLGSLRRLALGLSGLAAGLTLLVAGPASGAARTQVVPYLEVEQVLSADLNEGDTLTYTSVAVGVDAQTSTRRVQAQVSYRYERRIAWEDNLADDDVHTGLAQMRAQLVPNTLTFNAGALATRARTDAGAPIFGFGSVDSPDLADVYSFYAGPDFTSRAGPVDVTASYRLGYVKVDDHGLAGFPLSQGARSIATIAPSTTASPQASAWLPAIFRSAGRSARAMSARTSTGSTRSSKAGSSAAMSSFRSLRPSPSPPVSDMRKPMHLNRISGEMRTETQLSRRAATSSRILPGPGSSPTIRAASSGMPA
jgi:hypothetical protein